MVRIISEKFFSPPSRSRHSSGETVDRELAARAVEALSGLNSRRPEFSDYESSSDSHWDSEVDVEGEGTETGGPSERETSTSSTLGEECSGGADVVQKRKERRRERNKLSAQAYRIRRREQGVKQQTVLRELQEKNSRLKEQVHSLQDQIDHLRRSAVVRPPPPPPLPPHSNSRPSTPTPTPSPTSTPTADAAFPALVDPTPLQPAWDMPLGPGSDVQPEGTRRSYRPCPPIVDNDLSRRQLLSPLVDNFSSHASSPAPSPVASPSDASLSSSSSSRFSFPVPSSPAAVGCHYGVKERRYPPPALYPQPPSFVPSAVAGSVADWSTQIGNWGPQVGDWGPQLGGNVGAYPHPQEHRFHYPFHPSQCGIDLNANAEEEGGRGNMNVMSTVGACQKNDNVNNNTNNITTGDGVPSVSPLGGARPKIKSGVPRSSGGPLEVGFRFSGV